MTAPPITEQDMERTLRAAVEAIGGICWHIRDSRGLAVEHMPDLVVVTPSGPRRPGIIAFLELKSPRRDLTPGQARTLDLLAAASEIVTGVVRPRPRPGEFGFDDMLRILTAPRDTEETT